MPALNPSSPSSIEFTATILFALAVLHTFLCSRFLHAAHRYPADSVRAGILHLLGEVEVVFGLWAGLLALALVYFQGYAKAIHAIEACNFTEPIFVFAIMTMAATSPVIRLARGTIFALAHMLPARHELGIYITSLVVGPLLGSLITEPAAMTVTALILLKQFYAREVSSRFKYATLAVLFVNVSIGGTLTNFAAPPVLMVATTWNWDGYFMLRNFGWKVIFAVIINAGLAAYYLRKELANMERGEEASSEPPIPIWVIGSHVVFLALVVLTSHHPAVFMGLFLFFIGMVSITQKWQAPLQLRQSLLVGFFLAGLVLLGGYQKWWLDPLIRSMSDTLLFLGATGLTAITDNAALTFLGSQVEGMSETSKYALVAGAVAGGGMTVIANAPNPAGFAILQSRFGPDGISPLKLALAALAPTLVAMLCLWLLP